MPNIYVSVDIETDGPIPGKYSMLSLGSVAYNEDGNILGTYYSNIYQLEGAEEFEPTMVWWKTQPEAWEALQENKKTPHDAMHEYVTWLDTFKGTKICVAYPAGFDFTFISWYLWNFVGENPFGISAIDIKTYDMAYLDTPFKGTIKRKFPKEWFEGLPPHTHNALDDAMEQGELFFRIRESLRGK